MNSAPQLAPVDLKRRLDAGEDLCLMDVRQPDEWEIGHIEGAQLIPLGQLPARADELPHDKPIVCYCHHGGRSAQAQAFLLGRGFPKVYNLTGGIHRWSREIDPRVPTY